MKIKIFACLLICLTCFMCFAGCSTITYTYSLNNDGTVKEEVSVVVFKEQMEGVDVDAFVTQISNVMQGWVDAEAQEHVFEVQGVSYEKSITQPSDTTYKVNLTINYNSVNAWGEAWGIDVNAQTDPVYQEGWFKDRLIIYQGQTEFAGALQTEMATTLSTWLTTNAPTFEWQASDIMAFYLREYPIELCPEVDKNGYKVPYNDGYAVCLWMFSLDNSDLEITMFRDVVRGHNRANWFITALGATAIFGVIMFFALRTRQRKTASNNSAQKVCSNGEVSVFEIFKSENQEPKQNENLGLKDITIQNENKEKNDNLEKQEEDLEKLIKIETPKRTRTKKKR